MVPGDRALAGQLGLFEQDLAPLEGVPLDFRYRFRCSDEDCPTHDMGLKDWEAGASYRKFTRTYGDHAVRDKLRECWYDSIFALDRAVRFFVGNRGSPPDLRAAGPVLSEGERRAVRAGQLVR